MKISRRLHYRGGQKSRRLLFRQTKRFYRQLVSCAFLLGCCWGSTVSAHAGFVKEKFLPLKEELWIAFYVCIGLFVVVTLWELIMLKWVREAEQEDLEAVQKSIAEAENKDIGSGLIADTADPFQALLNQANSPETAKSNEVSRARETSPQAVPEPKNDNAAFSAVSKPTSQLQPFNGAATLPVSVAMVGGKITRDPLATPSPDESNNPFRRSLKSSSEELKPAIAVPKLDIPASKPLEVALPSKPLELASPKPASVPDASGVSGKADSASAPNAPFSSAKPLTEAAAGTVSDTSSQGTSSSSSVPFSGDATVAVKPGSSVAASIAMVTGKPIASAGNALPSTSAAKSSASVGMVSSNATAPKTGSSAGISPSGSPAATPNAPVGMAGPSSPVAKPTTALAGAGMPSMPAAKPNASAGAAQASIPAAKPFNLSNMTKPGMQAAPPRSPIPSSSSAASAAKPSSVSGGSEDPWKKLLGQTGGRMGSAQGSSSLKSPASPGMSGAASKSGGSNPTRSLTGANGSGFAGAAHSSNSTGADDPWKALLGNSGKGIGSKANPSGASSAGMSLGIKKNDSVSAVNNK
ncbi:MAG: hypothetical protein Q4F00_11225 [bacterium]|nr:hypothetical protein [bacterium]